MFISIPKEFFVPVVFGEGFILNEENNNLELETNMYRESTGNKSKKQNINIIENKEYLENSKSAKEKQDIIDIEMDSEKCGNEKKGAIIGVEEKKQIPKELVKENVTGNVGEEKTNYIALKSDEEAKKICSNVGKIFEEIDDEFIENVEIKGCSEK